MNSCDNFYLHGLGEIASYIFAFANTPSNDGVGGVGTVNCELPNADYPNAFIAIHVNNPTPVFSAFSSMSK